MKMGRGFRMGNRRSLSSLGERVLFRLYEGRPDYPSVWYLFNRIRKGGMPGYGAEMIGDEVKIDIAAYILQANGLPAGARELTTDAATLKQLRIPNPAVEEPDETGFVPLFNGRDFSGWKFVLGPNCRPAPDGCGRTTPSGVFKVVDGKIVCTGQTQGYMYSDKKYLNLTLRFDYRFEPLPTGTTRTASSTMARAATSYSSTTIRCGRNQFRSMATIDNRLPPSRWTRHLRTPKSLARLKGLCGRLASGTASRSWRRTAR